MELSEKCPFVSPILQADARSRLYYQNLTRVLERRIEDSTILLVPNVRLCDCSACKSWKFMFNRSYPLPQSAYHPQTPCLITLEGHKSHKAL